MWNLLDFLKSAPPSEAKSALRALPSKWYLSSELFELERRAIFSKKWQLVTHKSRLANPGDWLQFDIANFPILLCKDREGLIGGFHNVCRHRAYPIVEAEQGCAQIFRCRYHGWSYGISGNLSKAPGYQDLEGFRLEENGLFPVHVHIDTNGFIWVNLDADETPEIAWDDDFAGIDVQERYNQFKFDDYEFDHAWQMDGPYNWKILADNYNECYHCAGTHPDIGELANLQSYSVTTQGMSIIHDAATTDAQRKAGLVVASTYYFPNASTNVSPHFFMIQRFVPNGPVSSSMQYQVFRNKHSSDEDFERVNQIYKRIMSEDKELCKLAQKNLGNSVFVNGQLHPRMEKGPLFFQHLVREAVMHHSDRESAAAEEIWPAQQKLPPAAPNSKRSFLDSAFCAKLEPCPANNNALLW